MNKGPILGQTTTSDSSTGAVIVALLDDAPLASFHFLLSSNASKWKTSGWTISALARPTSKASTP